MLVCTFHLCSRNPGQGQHPCQVLGFQSRLRPVGPDVVDLHRLPEQCCQCQRCTQDLTAALDKIKECLDTAFLFYCPELIKEFFSGWAADKFS
jgi:hypothetical protein